MGYGGKLDYRSGVNHGIEVGPGLGPLKGKVWRVGLMGYSSQPENVQAFLGAIKEILEDSTF